MSCSLSSSTLIQEVGFLVLVAHLPPPWVVPAAVFLLWCLCKFRGLCFSGMSPHANQSRRPAACFLLQSYTSAGFRGETGQKADKQKEGGEAGRRRDTERRAFKKCELPVSPYRCMWESVFDPKLWSVGKYLAHMLTAPLFILHSDSLFCVIYAHVFPSSRRPVFWVPQE